MKYQISIERFGQIGSETRMIESHYKQPKRVAKSVISSLGYGNEYNIVSDYWGPVLRTLVLDDKDKFQIAVEVKNVQL